MSTPPRVNSGVIMALGVCGLGILWAMSHPTVRGAGNTATIDGKTYVLRGAYDSEADASKARTKIKRDWRAHNMRGSVRVIRKKFRGTSSLWLVYTRSKWRG